MKPRKLVRMLKIDLERQHDALVALILRTVEIHDAGGNVRFLIKGHPHDQSQQNALQTLRATANMYRRDR